MEILNLATVAGFVTLLVAVLTAMNLFADNFERIMQALHKWRISKRKPTYILIPTVEEIARYSVKTPQRELVDTREISHDELAEILHEREIVKIRITMVAVVFYILFISIGLRLFYIGISRYL